MKRLGYATVFAIMFASVSFGQGGPLRTGFAVVTPITGGRSAFSVTETFTEQFGRNLVRSSVQPSPLVTLTSMVITTDPASGANTGIAILNPFDSPASVTLSLLNPHGVIISARTVLIGERQQRSRFVTELFADVPDLSEPFTGQLFISSNVPVAILALAFSGPFFTALPATQLSANNFSNAVDPFLLPQVATGGGWVSTITIANTSTLPQSVRVDVFDSEAGLLSLPISFSIPNTIVQPGAIVTFSTAPRN